MGSTMNIVVAIKQVPEISNVQVNPETGTLIRQGVSSILNPFCEYALDHAVRLKALCPDIRITTVSMGPPQARSALMRTLELGADRAVLVCDRKFAGADTWVTALTLAEAIRCTVPDFHLIFVGKQAIDGDTAQVGPEMAEILHLPQISYGTACEITGNNKKIRVQRETESGYQILETRLPALVSFSKGENIRRAPSFADILSSRKKPIDLIRAQDLNIADQELGLSGSFTQVVKIFPPLLKENGPLLSGLSPQETTATIIKLLNTIDVLEKKEGSL